jgi:cytochrome P450
VSSAALAGRPPAPAIPRLPGNRLFGHLLEFRRDRAALLDRMYGECGDFAEIRLFHRILVVAAPDLARAVLVDQADAFEKGPVVREYGRAVLGTGLLSCMNSAHRARRKLVAPAFAPRHIARYADAMAAAAAKMVERWFARGPEVRLDLADEMMQLALRVVGGALFSIDFGGAASGLSEALETVNRLIARRIEQPWRPPGRPFRRAVAVLDGALAALIAERRAMGPEAAPADLLSSLLFARDEEGRGLDDRQVRDDAMTLLVAGHETSATALAWALHLLGTHEGARDALAAEARGALGERTATYADLERLPYARQVMQEAMRLFPPVHSIGRQAFRDVELRGVRIPKGRLVIVSTYLLHRRADLFPDPLRFRPERFAAAPPPYAYLPFGHGPRVCVGNHFAAALGQLVLATLAQRVRFRPAGAPAAPEMLVTLRPDRVVVDARRAP